MNTPQYVQDLKRHTKLLVAGFVLAIIAALFAGFTVGPDGIQPRAEKTYLAATTVELTSSRPYLFQVEVPAEAQAIDPNTPESLIVREATTVDLTQSAIMMAYIAASDQVKTRVAQTVGGLSDTEGVTSVSRTTQPGGDERFPGRLSLPIIDIVGVATSPARAEEISTAATAAFTEFVTTQQDDLEVADDVRLDFLVLNAARSDEGEGSNPLIPVIVTFMGVFLLFVAATFIIEAVRRSRAAKAASTADDSDDNAPDTDHFDDVDLEAESLTDTDTGSVTTPSAETRRARSRGEAELVPSDD